MSFFGPPMLVEFLSFLKSSPQDTAAVARHLCCIFCIGEAFMTATRLELTELAPEVEIHNLYSPTGASGAVSHFEVTSSRLAVVHIGNLFGYLSFHVMDHALYDGATPTPDNLVEVADGEIGEHFIGGDCLARGNMLRVGRGLVASPSLVGRVWSGVVGGIAALRGVATRVGEEPTSAGKARASSVSDPKGAITPRFHGSPVVTACRARVPCLCRGRGESASR